jgi:hypothetical protein
MLEDLAAAGTPRARLSQGEQALLHGDHPAAGALGTGPGLGAWPRARPAAGRTRTGPRDAKRDRGPREGVLEGDPDLGLEVGPPTGSGPGGATATGASAEQVEEVSEPSDIEAEVLEAHAAAASRAEPDAAGGHLPDPVVLLAAVPIAQDVVGRGHVLEPFLGPLVAGVGVGMELLRQLPVRLLDLGLGGVLGHTENGVIVLLEPCPVDAHRRATFTPAGRMIRPLSV